MRPYLVALIVLTAGMAACGGPARPSEQQQKRSDPNLAPRFHLGDASSPLGYALKLEIDPDVAEFQGEVQIEVQLHSPLHTLWLHQKDLEITAARFKRGDKSVALRAIASEHDEQLLGLVATEELAQGPGALHIEFRGELGSIQALFRQFEGEHWYAYSDFEATDARAAFPCYDEPRFKVPWRIELLAPPDSIAFANSKEIARERQPGGKTLFRFEETRPLPSYLIAVAVGPFDLIEGGSARTPLRVIAPKGQAKHGRFVLDNTGTWLRYLEGYLGMPLPFAKLDFIAVPVFGGAMENPGLVTFSSGILLTQPSASTRQRRRAAGVTSHELAHMWFGNLITPADWNDLWLNEAFATWLSDKMVANWEPGRAREVLDIADKSTAYASDHALGGRSVRQAMHSREDIRDAFDAITYRKGGALLTMLEAWLGEEAMQAAVRSYLSAGDGGSVRAPDLVRAMRSANPKKQAGRILQSFFNQPGIPEIKATLHCEEDVTLEIVQSRYIPIAERARAGKGERSQQWTMPLCLRYPGDTALVRECFLLDQKSTTRRLRTKSCPAWILPNDRESGYYHYRLEASGFAALLDAKLDPREELGLVHNLVAGLRGGTLSVAFVLDALEDFAPSGEVAVQQAIVPLLYELEKSVIGPSERASFAAHIRRWYRKRLTDMGLASRPGESEQTQQLRPVLVHILVELGDDEELKAKALARVRAWLEAPYAMNLPLLDSLVQAAASIGDKTLALAYLKQMAETKNGRHTAVLFGALHAFSDPGLLAEALEESIPARIKLPNLLPVLLRVMAQPRLREVLVAKLFEEREAMLAADTKDARTQGKGSEEDRSAEVVEQRRENYEQVAELFTVLCDPAGKAIAKRFAGEEFDAGPVLAAIDGCIAFAAQTQASASKAFSVAPP